MNAQLAFTTPLDTLLHGDALAILRTLDANSVEALVTDPPAGVSFMGKDWDSFNRHTFIAFLSGIMAEALRVLKPGGHALVWALPRTSHWTAMALEDAGFEIRDVITHLFGSGFPKSHNLGNGQGTALKPANEHWILCRKPLSEQSIAANVARWGTGGLNIDTCRVGLEGIEHHRTAGSGAIGTQHGIYNSSPDPINRKQIARAEQGLNPRYDPQGRWPANLLLSHSLFCQPNGVKRVKGTAPRGKPSSGQAKPAQGIGAFPLQHHGIETPYADADGMETVEAWDCDPSCPIRLLDEQSGVSKTHSTGPKYAEDYANGTTGAHKGNVYGKLFSQGASPYRDTTPGGASRYFQCFSYHPKASRAERNAGCNALPYAPEGAYGEFAGDGRGRQTEHKPEQNNHPTVKPLALMSWLIRLITPPGGTVLDCFAGSGSTLVAAIQEGYHFIGIEQDLSYTEIARSRISHALSNVDVSPRQSQRLPSIPPSNGKSDKVLQDCLIHGSENSERG